MTGIIVVYFIIVIVSIVAFTILIRKEKRERTKLRFATGPKKNRLYRLQTVFLNIPYLRRIYQKALVRARVLYPSDSATVGYEVTKLMGKSIIWSLIVFFVMFLMAKGDIFYILSGLFIAAILFKNALNKRFEKAEHTLLVQFSEVIFSLISTYRESHGHLDDAIYGMLDDLPQLVSLHLSNIYDIIVSPNPEEKAEQYTDYAPNRYLLSFISLAVPVKVYGDKTLADGNTAFLKGLMNLKKSLNEEILKRENIDFAFSSLTAISVAAVFAMKPLEWFFLTFMPQTEPFFKGTFGIASMTVVFLVSYLCYSMILSLKTNRQNEIIDTNLWSKLAAVPAVSRILNQQVNRHYTVCMRKEQQMRAVGDQTGVKAFLVKSAACAAAAFLVSNVLFLYSNMRSAENALNRPSDHLETVIVPSEEYIKEMQDVSIRLASLHKDDKALDHASLAQEVRDGSMLLRADDHVLPVTKSIEEQVEKYQSVYFKWYYELIASALAALAFFIPGAFLSFQNKQIQIIKEDEVNGFNLLALIFMDMDGTQVSTVLEWMERFSYSYKTAISECIVNLEMGEQRALQKLYEYDTMFEFRKFVKALMTVDDIGFANAFTDIQIQQDYYNEKRKLDNQKLIKQKSATASRIAFAPVYMVMLLYIIIPMLLFAATIFRQVSSVMP